MACQPQPVSIRAMVQSRSSDRIEWFLILELELGHENTAMEAEYASRAWLGNAP